MMRILDFLSVLIEGEMKPSYTIQELYDMYLLDPENANDPERPQGYGTWEFGRDLFSVTGTSISCGHASMYSFDVPEVREYIHTAKQMALITPEEREELWQKKEEEKAKCKLKEEEDDNNRKTMLSYAHGDSAARLMLEPVLHQIMEEPVYCTFIRSLASAADRLTAEHAGVYVLKLEGLPHTHYVGCSKNVLARIEQHRRGDGAECTARATSIQVLPPITPPVMIGGKVNLNCWEMVETLTLMRTLGINKVRGWQYVKRYLSDEDTRDIYKNICSHYSLCNKCGSGDHMSAQCNALHSASWMGGRIQTGFVHPKQRWNTSSNNRRGWRR